MRLILTFLMVFCLISGVRAAELPDVRQITQTLEQAKKTPNQPYHAEIIDALQSALNAMADRKSSLENVEQYRRIIDDYPKLSATLNQQLAATESMPTQRLAGMTIDALNQESLLISNKRQEQSRIARQEQERMQNIADSLNQLPQQQTDARRQLNDIERRLNNFQTDSNPLSQAKQLRLKANAARLKALVDDLELAQLSARNRLELARLRAELAQKQQESLDSWLQVLRNQLNNQRQRGAEEALQSTEKLAEKTGALPKEIEELFRTNRQLSIQLNEQAQRMESVATQQRKATRQTLQVHEALNTLHEQSQWVGASNTLGEILRAEMDRLPDAPKPQKLDTELAQLRVQRLRNEELLSKQDELRRLRLADGQPLNREQANILEAQLNTQRELLNSLLQGGDTLTLELTRLKMANSHLTDALKEVDEATNRYLFWTADLSPLDLDWPLNIVDNLQQLLSLNTFSELGKATMMMLTNRHTLLPLFGALILVGFSLSSRRHFHRFLQRSAERVGKVTLDHFRLTLRTVFWSILVALPLPVLWAALGYGLQEAWPFPLAMAIGDGVTATVPLLWAVMITATFARPNGLFITHFGWPLDQVTRALRYYALSVGLIVPLIMALIVFDNFKDRQFASSLGRLCFMLMCGAVTVVTLSLKRAGIQLFIDRQENGDNMANRMLWGLMIILPLIGIVAAGAGYLATAQALLARLYTSIAIWFMLLIIYYVIRRWMLIQRRRIAFDRARHKRAEILAQRAKGEDESVSSHNTETASDTDEMIIDLDAISIQSLRLVRSLLMLIALVSVIFLWSGIHSAFSFLKNISLWDVTSTGPGGESIGSVSLGSLLVAILVFIVTLQLVRNLPALLELALLQHLNLTPGTGYAITTVTKYLLTLVGVLIGFSIIGLEWAKLQWLVAALSVGLGFGLQEIFVNFISGLIILFEKPIRIGDTVTIRDLTGSVTKINTRATTINDWDRKEVIVPNKAFITEQFVNWSLSDSVTRVVLTLSAPVDVATSEVTDVLLTAARRCTWVLDSPQPEAWLVDLQQGVQMFELRVYAAEMGHRMPLRHELHQRILEGYAQHGIDMPYPPFQMRLESLNGSKTGYTLSSPRGKRQTGGL